MAKKGCVSLSLGLGAVGVAIGLLGLKVYSSQIESVRPIAKVWTFGSVRGKEYGAYLGIGLIYNNTSSLAYHDLYLTLSTFDEPYVHEVESCWDDKPHEPTRERAYTDPIKFFKDQMTPICHPRPKAETK